MAMACAVTRTMPSVITRVCIYINIRETTQCVVRATMYFRKEKAKLDCLHFIINAIHSELFTIGILVDEDTSYS